MKKAGVERGGASTLATDIEDDDQSDDTTQVPTGDGITAKGLLGLVLYGIR